METLLGELAKQGKFSDHNLPQSRHLYAGGVRLIQSLCAFITPSGWALPEAGGVNDQPGDLMALLFEVRAALKPKM